MITTKHLFVTWIFGLKLEEKCFFVIQISVTKIIGKTVIWTNFRFWVSLPNYTNLGFMFLTQQSHVQLCVLWNLHCKANNFVLLEKKKENKDIASSTQTYRVLVWAQKSVKTYIIVT